MKQYNKNYYNRLKIGAILLALFLLIPFYSFSQAASSNSTRSGFRNDSIANRDSVMIVGKRVAVKKGIKYYSPDKASMYSAVLPGMGQIYNKKYWKAPIVWGALGVAGYFILYNKKNYTKFSNAYRDYILQDPGNTSYLEILNDPRNGLISAENDRTYADFMPGGKNSQWFVSTLNNKKTIFKKNLDYSYIAVGIIYVLNIIDASVDAHFKQFDISDDLSLNWEPICIPNPALGTTFGMALSFSFK